MTTAPIAPTDRDDSRRDYADVVRALGTLAVVMIHVAGGGVALFDTGGDRAAWWVYNVADSACRWAVPVFVMLSGALLLDPAKTHEGTGRFYRKRLARIAPPLFFWSAFYLWLRWFLPGHIPFPATPEQALKTFLFANPYYHLYFLFVMITVYVFTPALRRITGSSDTATVRGYAFVALLFACGDTLVRSRYAFPSNVFAMGVPYLGYFLLGYSLRNGATMNRTRWLCGVGLVASVAVTAIGTAWTMSHWHGAMRQYLYNFFSPTACVMAVCVFALLAGATYTSPIARTLRPVTRLLSDTSFGVYLVHPLLLLLAQRQGFGAERMAWWLYLPGVTACVLVASIVLTRLFQATRVTRPLVG
ncbi:MAG: acyltransferase family protein [Armatimonadetes bacterium]|nr:acyltransferase family protein [Armatimonadota bacterium]